MEARFFYIIGDLIGRSVSRVCSTL